MKNIQSGLEKFNSLKGYFLSDKKALAYIKQNVGAWDMDTLNGKIGVLGLRRLVPDYQYNYFLNSMADSDVKNAVRDGDLNIFKILVHDLSYLDRAKFITSTFLCAHAPDHFPIWDERKALISGWQKRENNFSYETLKGKIDLFKEEKRINSLDYFYFNKRLWYCE